MRRRVLVADSEFEMLDAVSEQLTDSGFEVCIATSGREALEKACNRDLEIMVLATDLPDINGLALCQLLRKRKRTREIPVVLVAAEDMDERTLQSSVKACLAKPFHPVELLWCIEGILTAGSGDGLRPTVLRAGALSIDVEGHAVTLEGYPVSLTLTEFRLLLALIQQNGRVRSRESLMEELWQDETVDPRTVDTHVARLREKLGNSASLIDTVYGVGYRILTGLKD